MACLWASLQVVALAQITKRDDTVGMLLNEWYRDGTAAGLAAITYENRDGQHSPLNTALYPQLQVFEHSSTTGPDKGPAAKLRLGPVLGNCSMAASAVSGGSLPRIYMMDPGGGQFLMMQYLANNLFVYPEHQDHDIGANGIGGYGDLFPTNTPCCLISQGSSGSDQPFLQALMATTAAFPRETQRVLIQKRLLAPTLQAILRQCSRAVVSPGDYYTGVAHPVVFAASVLNEEKMVRMAQAMTPDKIPPLVQVEVLEETVPEPLKQVFEVPQPKSHKLVDGRVSISRVFRGSMNEYGMLLDLSKSADIMGRPIKLRFQVLQGDPRLVRVDHSGEGPFARLRVRWQPPIIGKTGIRSHRLDIGVFAANGSTVSMPAIISFYMLPNERRFINERGRLAEVNYQARNPDLGLPVTDEDVRWIYALRAAVLKGDDLPARLMQKLVKPEQRSVIEVFWRPLNQRLRDILQMEAKPESKDRAASLKTELGKDVAKVLSATFPKEGDATVKMVLVQAFEKLADVAELNLAFTQEVRALAKASSKASALADVEFEVRRLLDLGILIEQADGTLMTQSAPDRLTAADRHYLREMNLTVLSQALFPQALERAVAPAWVDLRLTTPKPWRDVMRYDRQTGQLLGWVRHQAGRTHYFDAEGRHLPEGPDHPEKAMPVSYDRNGQGVIEWR